MNYCESIYETKGSFLSLKMRSVWIWATLGIQMPEDLLLVKDSDIDVMIRNSSRNMPDNVQFPFLAVRKCHVFHFWVEECNRTEEDLLSAIKAIVPELLLKMGTL